MDLRYAFTYLVTGEIFKSAICLRRDMPRTARREDLYSRTFHHIRYKRIYRYLAERDNIAFEEQIYRIHFENIFQNEYIAFAKRT